MAVTGTFTGDLTFSASAATQSVPTGSYSDYGKFTWTVPEGVKVVYIDRWSSYVGVTPKKKYTWGSYWELDGDSGEECQYLWSYVSNVELLGETAGSPVDDGGVSCTISWSPEINTHTPDVTDY